MKRISKPVFFIVAILIIAFAFTAFAGIKYYEGDIQKTAVKGISDIRWGIDIRGGVEATFKPAEDIDATDEQLDSAKSIIETSPTMRFTPTTAPTVSSSVSRGKRTIPRSIRSARSTSLRLPQS